MFLISLMLAAAPMSAVKPDTPRRETSRDRPTSSASRSKRLIELEAAVRSLPIATAERDSDAGPQGM